MCACRSPQGATPVARDRGGVAEWLKAADCKSAGGCLRRFESYPLHQRFTIARTEGVLGPEWHHRKRIDWAERNTGGCSSMVELQPSKLATWVRFPSPAPAF